MKKELTKEQKDLYARVDEVLFYIWDPIGVCNIPEARNEYSSYLPNIFSLLINKKDDEIKNKLIEIQLNSMGMLVLKENIDEVVEILIIHRNIILK